MKVKIEEQQNGFIVTYEDGYIAPQVYVYKSTEDLWMWEEIAKKFLKRRIKAIEQ
jgi:hypothetical protein